MSSYKPFGRAKTASVDFNVSTVSNDRPDAAKVILQRISELYDINGVTQVGDVISLVGALGGFASQQAVWKSCIEPGNRNPGDFLWSVGTSGGEILFYGEATNLFLTCTNKGHYSFYSLVAGAIPENARSTLPDIRQLMIHVARTAGTPDFGIPKAAGRFENPRTSLNRNWRWVQDILLRYRNPPAHWPFILGFVANQVVKNAGPGAAGDIKEMLFEKDHRLAASFQARFPILNPQRAALLMMEAAIAMSKVNPASVPGATSGLVQPEAWSNRAVTPAFQAEIAAEVLPLLPIRGPF